jgi:phosphatidylethanolamine N-methyltransferase
MACSAPFEIVAPATTENHDDDAMQLCLLKLVQSVLDHDPRKMPMSPVDDYLLDVRSAKKMAYAIKLMWGVEFAPEVVLADGRVSRLAKRVQVALQALSPFDGQKVKKRSSSSSLSMVDGEGYEAALSTSPVKRSHLSDRNLFLDSSR